MSFDVVVLGSINHDLTVVADRHPQPGETILGTRQYSGPGGKGANQAVAAARLGSRVALIGRVGDDPHGHELLDILTDEGVDVSGVVVDDNTPTGLAVITVDLAGENTIVVVPGANGRVDRPQVREHSHLIEEAAVVLAQLEIRVEAVQAAASIAPGRFCLNPAPARELPDDLLRAVDVLIPNRGELARLARRDGGHDLAEVIDLAREVKGPEAIVVTLGSEGALVAENGQPTHLPSPEVETVDTTGAGDAFCGALAHALADGSSLVEAARTGVAAGALATTRPGAQSALPTLSELKELL